PDEIGLQRRAGEQHLDRDVARFARRIRRGGRPFARRGPDLAHPSTAEQTRDAIARQNVTPVDRHRPWSGTVPRTRPRPGENPRMVFATAPAPARPESW